MLDDYMAAENVIPIRVLFAISSLRLGGSQHVLIELLKGLDRHLFDPHLALLDNAGEFRDRVPSDVPVHPLKVRRARNAVFPLASLCWRLRPQVILSFSAQLNTAAIVAHMFMPRSTSVLAREGANVTLPAVAGAARRLIYRSVYSHAHQVICQSDDMVERLSSSFRIPKHRLVRIYNSVDSSGLTTLAQERSPYDTPGPNLVAVSRLVPVKGIDLLIEAMPKVIRIHPNTTLTLVGGGPQESQLRILTHRMGLDRAVRFIGFQANPFPYIYHADLLIIASRSDAFPNVALEALALGTHVVATDCPGGIREISRYTKHLTLATEIGPGQLALAINRALERRTSERRTRRSTRHQVEEEFLREFSPARIIAMYQRTLAIAAGAGAICEDTSAYATAR